MCYMLKDVIERGYLNIRIAYSEIDGEGWIFVYFRRIMRLYTRY